MVIYIRSNRSIIPSEINFKRKGSKNMGSRYELNKELAQMLKGGVIMDVTTPEQAKIAEEAGACAVGAGANSRGH